jgi:hypothetical protein
LKETHLYTDCKVDMSIVKKWQCSMNCQNQNTVLWI